MGEPKSQRTASSRWQLKLAFCMAIMLFLVILAELVLSLTTSHRYIQRGLRRGGIIRPYEPGAEAELLTDEFRVRYRINSFGFRDKERSLEKSPGQRRLLLLGDSFGEAWGVAQDRSFAALLEAGIDDTELWNAARAAGCQVHQVYQVQRFVPRFKPDLVLVQIFDNDPMDNWRIRQHIHFDEQGRVGPLPANIEPEEGLTADLRDWFRQRELRRRFKLLKKRLEGEELFAHLFIKPGRRAAAKILTRAEVIAKYELDLSVVDWPNVQDLEFFAPELEQQWDERFQFQTRLLEAMIALCRDFEVGLAFIYVPDRRVFIDARLSVDHRTRNPHLRRLIALSKTQQVPLLDLQELLAGEPSPLDLYFAYDGHLNEAGHAAVARHARPWLESILER